jgi:hypothetical protein
MAYEHLLEQFVEKYKTVASYYSLADYLVLIFWLLLLTVLGFAGIFKYLHNLNLEIWKTRSMMNMIPNEIICNNIDLKRAFMSKGFLRNIK